MSNRGSNSRRQRPDVVVGVHEAAPGASEAHVVALRSGGPGQGARVILAKTLARASLAQELAAFKNAEIVRVAPLERTIARLGMVPLAPDHQMQAAVNLMAEAEFPASVPAHRIAAAVLPAAEAGAQTRAALFTAWIGKETPAALREGTSERWTTPLGALAALRGKHADPIVHADRRAGAVAALLQQQSVQAARVVVDDPADDLAWEHLPAACVQELAASTGGELDDAAAAEIVHRGAWTTHTSWLNGRVTGAIIDSAWLSNFGLALGAAMVLTDESLGLAPLCDMAAQAPRVRTPGLVRLGEWISQGSRPLIISAAALALLVGVPFGLSFARYHSLQSRRDGLESINRSASDIKLKAAMFKQLETSRVPMTKLLSDIAGAAPVGVEIVETRLAVGQDITIRGKATSADLHRQFVRNLNATKLFAGNVKETRTESKDSVTEFEVSAKLDRPHLPVKPSGDFTTTPLAVQLWGEGATNTTMPVGAVRQVTASGKPVAGAARPAGGSAAATPDRRPSPSATASSTEPPPEVSDADIAKMTRNEAMRAWSLRAGWLTANGKADPAVRDRVTAERTKLQERMQAAAKEEQGGAK